MGMDMPMATDTNTTSTRFSASSIVTGMTVPVLAGATATDADAEIPLVPRLAWPETLFADGGV
jgi:hypothetical protein